MRVISQFRKFRVSLVYIYDHHITKGNETQTRNLDFSHEVKAAAWDLGPTNSCSQILSDSFSLLEIVKRWCRLTKVVAYTIVLRSWIQFWIYVVISTLVKQKSLIYEKSGNFPSQIQWLRKVKATITDLLMKTGWPKAVINIFYLLPSLRSR